FLSLRDDNPMQLSLVCPICLGSFKDPVILDCGHNYCQACITDCWGASGTGLCPQCRKSLPEGELRGLEGKCKKHEEVFKLFCKEDRTLLCRVCRESREHKVHTVIPIEAAAKECKVGNLDRNQRRETPYQNLKWHLCKQPSLLPGSECRNCLCSHLSLLPLPVFNEHSSFRFSWALSLFSQGISYTT
uniref:RING-type domain-containing protein n=1 Tax=Terrapene triunguis TaxID=2587831 RepID=A0A674JPF3_9SAUR